MGSSEKEYESSSLVSSLAYPSSPSPQSPFGFQGFAPEMSQAGPFLEAAGVSWLVALARTFSYASSASLCLLPKQSPVLCHATWGSVLEHSRAPPGSALSHKGTSSFKPVLPVLGWLAHRCSLATQTFPILRTSHLLSPSLVPLVL